ncbi:hypothetical protein DDB_G0286839 [Dictyostelium discoideum AX4]|uniref:GATA zinc finger domain-containing protein 23 n=1 Tax=Dictyostelium discoideum TaxID=44689 RepID=GTAW_DICDI|nr:hypothetical protein DDB_G0286839 [Dictyostelium discoideum AX4]Q54L82.1 RecName: Full=GATA zinc finger domain-containing protein 23 [Dictyostelium discoideum]EAL64017.1 hypothetical protein DDB_G0286839 [Dictyostelium discoideum AX4]|eukprot:XP_637521.1 hypothetical protein DDB_G0286839 [Dictyostelium discoideum AX4]
MVKRNNNNSINYEINKIIPVQTTKDINSKREKEIHVQIKKINSNRTFVYENIHRHILLVLENFGSTKNLFLVLSDCLATLKGYDSQEYQLQLELQTISDSTTTTTTNTVSTVATASTSKTATSKNVISNIENNTNKSQPLESNDLTPPSSKSSNSSPSTSPSKRVSKSKTRVTKKPNQVISTSSSGETENLTTTSTADTTATTDTADTTDGTNTRTSNTSSDDTTTESTKKRGRPSKIQPDSCYVCRRTFTSYWRKGIFNDQNEDLCNPCGLNYLKKGKKEQISKNQNSIHNILN